MFDGTYDDNGEDDDVNEDDKGNLQWIAEQVYGTTDETGDEEINPPNEELSVFSDVVQQAFEKFENQVRINLFSLDIIFNFIFIIQNCLFLSE